MINAATIYAEVQAARLALSSKISDLENSPEYLSASLSDQYAMGKSLTASIPSFVTFRTSEKGTMRVVNTLKRLEEFAALVKQKAAIFGGGFAKPERKAKPAISWPAPAIKVACEAMEDGDYAGALQLAEEKLGAFFAVQPIHSENKNRPRALLILAPLPVAGLPDCFVSARIICGSYQVFHLASGLTLGAGERTRSKAEARALAHWEKVTPENREKGLTNARPRDEQEARAQWMAEHKLSDESEIERFTSLAAQQVAEFEAAEAVRIERQKAKEKIDMQAAYKRSFFGKKERAELLEKAKARRAERQQAAQARALQACNADASDAAIDAHIAALAARDVAQVVAMAQAAAVIEQAQAVPANAPASQPAGADQAKTPSGEVSQPAALAEPSADQVAAPELVGGGEGRPSKNEIVPTVSPVNYLGDIPASLALSAYSGTSFSPERRGTSARNEYSQSMSSDLEEMRAQAVKGGTLELLPEVFARYRSRQASAYRAYLASSSRIVSSFIAGPSNFPAARMNKRADIAHKRLTEYLDGGEMAKRAAVRTLRPDLRAIMAGDADAVDRLTVELESAERRQNQMKAANKAIRANAKMGEAHQVAALMEVGYNEVQAVKMLHPMRPYCQGFESFTLTNNQANIRRMKARLEQITAAKARPVVAIECASGITLEDDAPANRVRLFFPGKPSEEIRTELKAAGFRWAPSVGAWQAYRNHRTLTTAQHLAGEAAAQPEPAAPAEIEPTAPAVESQPEAATPPAEFLPEPANIEPAFSGRLCHTLTEEVFYTTPVMKIGRHEWITQVFQSDYYGRCTRSLWRYTEGEASKDYTQQYPDHYQPKTFTAVRGTWYSCRKWPSHDSSDGSYSGLPKTVANLYYTHEAAIQAALIEPAKAIEAAPAPAPAIPIQKAASKSGAWSAELCKIEAVFVLRFFSLVTGLGWATSHHATAGQRIRALQTLAIAADQAAQPSPAPASPAPVEPAADTGVGGAARSILESAPAFERVQPFSLDPRALLTEGVTAAQLIGLGVNYTGNMADLSGRGAITAVADNRSEKWGALRIVCTLEDGRVIDAEPHYFTASLRPILQFNSQHHGAPYLAELAMAAMLKRSSESSAAELASQAHAKALAALPLEFPDLILQSSDPSRGGVFAAKNIRIMLKKAFKGVKFSVTADYSAVRVGWTDGPTDAQVAAITRRFSGGSFDGMADSYEYSKSAFTDLFGSSQYIFAGRKVSDGLIQAAIDQHYQDQDEKPTVSDYQKNTGPFSQGNDSDRRYFSKMLNSMTTTR